MRLLLINPNTNEATTGALLSVARTAAAEGTTIEGRTAGFGAKLITNEAELGIAAEAVGAVLDKLDQSRIDGVIIAAFGDPGLAAARAHLAIPVTGIAEAGMLAAAEGGRRFSVVTTTPDLVASIGRLAARYGLSAQFAGVRTTYGDPAEIMADAQRLEAALADACRLALREDLPAAIVIGGGPLAVAARALRRRLMLPIIEPVPNAVHLAIQRGRGA
jgi:allantoin racemase